MIKLLKSLSILYLVLLISSCGLYGAIGKNTNEDGSKKWLDCYMSESAPMAGIHCKDTTFGSIIEWTAMFTPLLLFFSLFAFLEFGLLTFIALMGWSPLLYLVWYFIWGRHLACQPSGH